MRIVRRSILAAITILGLLQSAGMVAASEVNLTGTWESVYQFGDVEQIMTADIVQIGDGIIGTFSVAYVGSDNGYTGDILGSVNGDIVRAFYISSGNGGPEQTVSFADGEIEDENTLKGTFYYQDSDMIALTGPYEAIRKS